MISKRKTAKEFQEQWFDFVEHYTKNDKYPLSSEDG